MNACPATIPLQRYIASDSHPEYVMVGGLNCQKEWNLRPRKVPMPRFRAWAVENRQTGDAVVWETTANVWDIYDIVAPLVRKTVVANAYQVRQIAAACVKTDQADVKRLISLRWRIGKPITMSKNRLHSVIQRCKLDPPAGQLLADQHQPGGLRKSSPH